jgi:hypothetical protein
MTRAYTLTSMMHRWLSNLNYLMFLNYLGDFKFNSLSQSHLAPSMYVGAVISVNGNKIQML